MQRRLCWFLVIPLCALAIALALVSREPATTPRQSPASWRAGASLRTLECPHVKTAEHVGRVVYMRRYADGFPREEDFGVVAFALPELQPGEVRVRKMYVGFDAGPGRSRLGYGGGALPEPSPACEDLVGDLLWRAPGDKAIGRVIASRAEGLPNGTVVSGPPQWADLINVPASAVEPVTDKMPPSMALGLGSAPGVTAYLGVFEVLRARPGEVLFVSGAAGATGSIAAQLGKIAGCLVLGSAGGPRKVRRLLELGLDGVFDYRSEDPHEALSRLAPHGIDLFFENTGGPVSEAVLYRLRPGARVAVSGLVSMYHSRTSALLEAARSVIRAPARFGAANLNRKALAATLLAHHYIPMWHGTIGQCDRGLQRQTLSVGDAHNITVESFLCLCFGGRAEWVSITSKLAGYLKNGQLKAEEHILKGTIEDAPRAFMHMLAGGNIGSTVLDVGS